MSAGCGWGGKCIRVLRKGAGERVVAGGEGSHGEGKGAANRDGERAAEIACKELRSRGALGSGTPQPAMLANKVSEG